jgi:chorismate--pyruvate lyase
MQRGGMELARLAAGQVMHAAATCHLAQRPAEIWGRRTVFRLADKPLLVSEIFLPEFPAGSAGRPRTVPR